MPSISAVFGFRPVVAPPSSTVSKPSPPTRTRVLYSGGGSALVIECSSRPEKKATKHHMKTRPRKTNPSDIRRRGPTVYPPLPPLPADWSFVVDEESAVGVPEIAAVDALDPVQSVGKFNEEAAKFLDKLTNHMVRI